MALAGDATRAVFDEELPQLFGSGYFFPGTAKRPAFRGRVRNTSSFLVL